MKNIQTFVCLLVLAEPIFTSSVSKKLKPKDQKEIAVDQQALWDQTQAQARLARATVSVHPVPAVVLQPAYYQPKIDGDLLSNQADLGTYAALVGPESYGLDISKAFSLKGYHQPQYGGLGKYTDIIYKTEPLTIANKDDHYGTPESYVTLLQKHSDDHHDGHDKHHSYASSYQFGYRVKDPYHGSYFGHSEVSDGHVKKGQYHVLLPDGRLQNVKYHADHSGYHATVTYEGSKYYLH